MRQSAWGVGIIRKKNNNMDFICNTSESPRNPKARDLTFYLDKIRSADCEFDKLEVFCTDGDIRPPHPYQWYATTKILPGHDDPFEGIGWTPLEAIRNLWKEVDHWERHGVSCGEKGCVYKDNEEV